MQLDLLGPSTSWLEVGPAKGTALPESALASATTEATSGGNSSASSSRAKPRTSSRKTSAALFPSTVAETLESSSVRWPVQGSMLAGRLSARVTSGRPTSGSDSGFLLGSGNWATPRAEDYKSSGMWVGRNVADTLTAQPRESFPWPTPTLDDVNNATRDSGAYQSLTRAAVQDWPTPAATLMNDAETPEQFAARAARWKVEKGYNNSVPLCVSVKTEPGQTLERPRLNAAWVSQVMGWPDGWVTGLPQEVFGRLAEERRNTRGKRPASSRKGKKAT